MHLILTHTVTRTKQTIHTASTRPQSRLLHSLTLSHIHSIHSSTVMLVTLTHILIHTIQRIHTTFIRPQSCSLLLRTLLDAQIKRMQYKRQIQDNTSFHIKASRTKTRAVAKTKNKR